MDALSAFFSSEKALYYLGLPGLALLLAFLFYNGLVKAKVITPLTRKASATVVLAIIASILVVTVLAILRFEPAGRPAEPAKPTPVEVTVRAGGQISSDDVTEF